MNKTIDTEIERIEGELRQLKREFVERGETPDLRLRMTRLERAADRVERLIDREQKG